MQYVIAATRFWWQTISQFLENGKKFKKHTSDPLYGNSKVAMEEYLN